VTKETWIKIGRPNLVRSTKFLKVVEQTFVKPIGFLKGKKMNIMGATTYARLFRIWWGRKMKEPISLEKDRMKLKGNGRRIIIPIDPK
jgi:hypothetical protein